MGGVLRGGCTARVSLLLLLSIVTGCCALAPAAAAAAAAATTAAPSAAAGNHQHDGPACGQRHPDVVAAGLALAGARLALVELKEGRIAARALLAAWADIAARADGSGGSGGGGSGGLPQAPAVAAEAAAQLRGSGQKTAAADDGGGGGNPLADAAAALRALAAPATAAVGGARRPLGAPAPPNPSGTSSSSSGTSISSGSSSSTSSSTGPIRVHAVYQLQGLASEALRARVARRLVPGALAALAKYVRVRRGPPTVQLAPRPFDGRQSCLAEDALGGSAGDPSKHGADLTLYVTADGARCFPGMVAMSAACAVDAASGRPTVGSLNVCPDALAPLGAVGGGAADGPVVDSLVHELLHVLGFSPTHYPDWRGPDGQRYARPIVTAGAERLPFLATPKATAEARRHLDCGELPGAPLEAAGLGMSSLAHWRYTAAQHELMTAARPLDRQRAAMSRLTLAALEDTGWYAPDYSAAADLEWGAGAGCDLVLGAGCREFVARHPTQDLFCPPGYANATRCSAGGRLVGVCKGSSFTDGCLIVAREPPPPPPPGATAAAAARDFARTFECADDRAAGLTLTAAALARLGAVAGGGGAGASADERCFNVAGSGGGGAGVSASSSTSTATSSSTGAPPRASPAPVPALCTVGVGGRPECARVRALCYRAACDGGGRLSVTIAAPDGRAPAATLPCPTGTTLNLGAKLVGRFASGALECPDNARVCRGLGCGACDPTGGYCGGGAGGAPRCSCYTDRTGPGCHESLLPPIP